MNENCQLFFFSFLGPKMRNSLIFYLTFYTSILTLRKLNQLKIKRWPFVRSHINYPHIHPIIHPTFYLRVDDNGRCSCPFMKELIKLYNKFPWISVEIHENFQGIFQKIITEKSLVTQIFMLMKIRLETQEIFCK